MTAKGVAGLLTALVATTSCFPGDRGGDEVGVSFDRLPTLTFDLEEFPRAFSQVTGSAAARDGLFLTDRFEHLVAKLHFDAGVVDTVGREGSGGPGEYTAPRGLVLLAGDTLVVREDRRWIVFDPDGAHVSTWVPEWLGRVGTGVLAGSPHSADIFVSGTLEGSIVGDRNFDDVARWNRTTDSLEVLDSVARPAAKYISLPNPSGTSRFRASQPFSPRDRWAPAGRGGLVIARGASSTVEFLDRNGDQVAAFSVDAPPIPISAEERAEHDDPRFEWDWPENKPFFSGGSVVVDHDTGVAWIPVSETPRSAVRYYVIADREEGTVARAQFPEGFTLRAMGYGFGYGMRSDEDTGLQRVYRFRSDEWREN